MNYAIAQIVVHGAFSDKDEDWIKLTPIDSGMKMCDIWDPLADLCGVLEEEGLFGEIVNEHSRIIADPSHGDIFHVEIFPKEGQTREEFVEQLKVLLARICKEMNITCQPF